MKKNDDDELPWDEPKTVSSVTVNNIAEIGYQKMLEGIMPLVLIEVPEGTNGGDPAVMTILDGLMGKYANIYAYLITLFAAAAGAAERYRIMDADDKQKDCIRKKDALWELSRAVKLKYQACSRMLTKHIEDDEDLPERADVRGRAMAAEHRRAASHHPESKQPKGWRNIGD